MIKRCPNCGWYNISGQGWVRLEEVEFKKEKIVNEVCIGCSAFYENIRKEKK